MANTIEKTSCTMERLDSEDQLAEKSVTFVLARGDGAVVRTLLLSYPDWVDMGSPDEVTVTIEPGNVL